jgi:hypothetical protein
MKYLEFIELEHYVQHLQEKAVTTSRLEYSEIKGKPDKHGAYAIGLYAVATADLGDHIAYCSVFLGSTLNLFVQHPDERHRKWQANVFARFDAIKEQLEAEGLAVLRGRWTFEASKVLKGAV